LIFEISMPGPDNRCTRLRLERMPDSDAEAISRVYDHQDRNLEPVDDRTVG